MIYKKLKYEMLNIFESYTDPVVIVNGNKISSINSSAKKLFKIDNLDKYRGENISILKSPNEKYDSYFTVINEKEEEFLKGDKTIRFKFKHIDNEDKEIDTEVLMFKIYDAYDDYLYGILIYDLSDYIEKEKVFNDDIKILKSIRNEDSIILIIDQKTRDIIDCSQRACSFYGFSPAKMKNMNIKDINTLSDGEIKSEAEKAAKEKRNHFIFRHKISSGEIKLVRVISGPVRYYDKDCLYSIILPFKEDEELHDSVDILINDNFEYVFKNLPYAAMIMDPNFNIVAINNKFSLTFNYRPAEVIGHNPIDNIVPSEFVEETHAFQSVIDKGKIISKGVFRKNKFGEVNSYSLKAYPIRKNSKIIGSVAIYDENSEVRNLKHKMNLIEKINQNLNEGMIITNHKGEIKWLNRAYSKITGYSLSELTNKNPRILKSGKQDQAFYNNMWHDIEKYGSWSGEILNVRKDGSEYAQWETIIKVQNEYNDTVNYIAVISDISGFKAQEEKIKTLAYSDMLTGLNNRAYFMENACSIIEESLSNKYFCAVMYMDLDKFKDINDNYGHEVGDKVLRHVATSIKSVLKSKDLVARIGGDEFAVVLTDLDEFECLRAIVRRIIQKVGEKLMISDHEIEINISIGIAITENRVENLSSILKKADLALYRAKKINGGSYSIYEEFENAN